MSKGLGKRQRDILAKLAQHRENPPDYNGHWFTHIRTGERTYRQRPEWAHDRYPEWMTVSELARIPSPRRGRPPTTTHSDAESTRRAVRTLEAAGLVQTRIIYRNNRGFRQIGVRLNDG
jgi:ribosomal protein S19E (S16A)